MSAQEVVEDLELRRIDEAAQWMETLRSGAMDESTLAAWLKWSADPQNLQEFEGLQHIWDGVGKLSHGELNAPSQRRFSRLPLRTALAASLVLSVGASAWLVWRSADNPYARSYDTPVAVTSDIPLADGSRVELGPLSKISTRLTETSRIIDMKAGEAYFEVARDPARPFIVNTGEVQIAAIGTAFNIHKAAGHVRVTVTEGAIRVSATQTAGNPPIEAQAGQRVEYSVADRRLAVSGADLQVATAWRSGVLKFVDEPLQNVVADLNRYTERKIVVEDAVLDTLPYTGTVFAGRIDQWLIALQDAFPLYVEPDGKDRVRLKMK